MIQSLTARSPAKLIISGEHAVLYEQPALAIAIDRYTTVTTSWSDTKRIHFKLLGMAYAKSHTLKALQRLTANLQRDYNNFLQGKCGIRSVLKRPFQLLQYSVSSLLDYLNVQLPKGMEIAVDSSIPIGCGMGSSAAAVVSTLYAITNFLQIKWQRADYLSFSRAIENLQHGKSSGLDTHLVTYGGCVYFQNGKTNTRAIPNMPMYMLNTGKPVTTTGECVSSVAALFAQDTRLVQEFGMVTASIDAALNSNNIVEFKHGVRANHRLLTRIGVVPAKVAAFIRDIEAIGGAAKVCGAGAVRGNNAGIVLVLADQGAERVAHAHGYTTQLIQVDNYGTTIL